MRKQDLEVARMIIESVIYNNTNVRGRLSQASRITRAQRMYLVHEMETQAQNLRDALRLISPPKDLAKP